MNEKQDIFLMSDSARGGAVSRRGFLKGSALAGLSLGVAGTGLVGCAPKQQTETDLTDTGGSGASVAGYQYEAETAEGEWHHNACPRNCYDTCAICSKVVDGRIVELRGNKDNTYTAGGTCVKTQHYLDYLYSEDRILYPMKRTGQKGPGCTFERITWEEAIDTIATRWKEIIAEDGPDAIAPYTFSGHFGFINGGFYPACMSLFYRMKATVVQPTLCASAGMASFPYVFGGRFAPDFEEAPENLDLYVSWGSNEAASASHSVKFIAGVHRNGGKIIVVNPIYTPLCEWADMHLKITSGTDSALALGVSKILIDEGLVDQEFIDTYTKDFEAYKQECDKWDIAHTAEITGLTEQEIIDFAHAYGSADRSLIKIGENMNRHANGGMMCLSASMLPVLTGQLGKNAATGWWYSTSCWWGMDNDKTSCGTKFREAAMPADGKPWESERRTYACQQVGELLNGMQVDNVMNGGIQDYGAPLVKSLYVFNGNPMVSNPNRNLVEKGLLREDLFTVVHDIFVTPTVEYADIVLPAPTLFESEDLHQSYGSLWVLHNEQTIEPLGESKSNWETACLLAKAMGYDDPEFDRSFEELANELLSKNSPQYSGATYEDLKEKGQIKAETGVAWAKQLSEGFGTPSTKIEFAPEGLKTWHGVTVPSHTPEPESEEAAPELYAEYPIHLLSNNSKEMLNGCFGNLPDNVHLMGTPLVYLNTEDAAARGIEDGDTVLIFNERGETTRVARVVEGFVAKGHAQVFKSTWDSFAEVENINVTTRSDTVDFGNGTGYQTNLVQIEKA